MFRPWAIPPSEIGGAGTDHAPVGARSPAGQTGAVVTTGLARVRAVIDRIAVGVGELAWARRPGTWTPRRYYPVGGRSAVGGRPGSVGNPFRAHSDHPAAVPAFRKLDAVAVLTARLLPGTQLRAVTPFGGPKRGRR
jgi:hypothetical protein